MNLCSDGHDEICYEVRKCPLCEMMIDCNNLLDEKDNLQIELETAQSARDTLENQMRGSV